MANVVTFPPHGIPHGFLGSIANIEGEFALPLNLELTTRVIRFRHEILSALHAFPDHGERCDIQVVICTNRLVP